MQRLLEYKGYTIWSMKNQKRMYVDGSGISCNMFWYSMDKAIEHIDFVIKFKLNNK